MKKRLWSIILCVFMFAAVLPQMAFAEGVIAPEDDYYIEVTAWVTQYKWSGIPELNHKETRIGAAEVAATNMNILFHFLPDSDATTAFNLKIADGNWEDIIHLQTAVDLSKTFINTLVENDVVAALDEYFEMPDKYPNLAKYSKEVLDFWRSDDGHIYGIPSAYHHGNSKVYWMTNGYYVLPEIAEQVGISVDSIKTTEDVKNFLLAVKEANLTSADGLSILPFAGSANLGGIRTILSSFGVETTGNGYALIDGQWTHWRNDPKYKDAMKFLNELYRTGVMDPEYVSVTNDMLNERLLAQRVAMYVGEAWPFWMNVTVGETPVTALEETSFIKAPGVDQPGFLQTVNTSGEKFLMINKNADIERIMRWADYYADTTQPRDWQNIYGPVGVLWEYDESRGGAPYFKVTDEEVLAAAGDYKRLDEIGFQAGIGPYGYEYDLNEFAENNEGLFWIFKMNTWWGLPENRYYTLLRPQDSIQPVSGGVWETNFGALRDADLQAQAALIMAEDDDAFEKAWADYRDALELKGKWSSADAETLARYEELN